MAGFGWPPVFGQPPLFPQFPAMNYPYEGYPFHHQGPSYMAPPPGCQFPPYYYHHHPHSASQRGLSDSSSDEDTDTDISQKKSSKRRNRRTSNTSRLSQHSMYPPFFTSANGCMYNPQYSMPPGYCYQQADNRPWRNTKPEIYSDTSSDDEENDSPKIDRKKNKLFWKKSSLDEELPEGAIVGGRDTNGCTIYVGKAHYKGEELPAKVIPKSRYAAVAYKGEEIFIKKFKVLCERKPYRWVKSKNGSVPKNAIPGGVSEDGEILYIGRGPHCGSVTVGKVSCSKGCLLIPFGNAEHSYTEYEVLVQN